jgi:signal transduction histidine kinase
MQSLTDATVLVVDDDPGSLALCEQVLTTAGYRNLLLYTDPRAALAEIDPLAIDLVIADLQMPEIDGLRLVGTLRGAVPEDSFLPVLVVTADATTATRRTALGLGADDFLTKPIDVIEMTLRVGHLLRLRSLHRALYDSRFELAAEVEARTEELQTALGRLENVVKAKDVFIASVSHELRTPLTAVLGYASELADRAGDVDTTEVVEAAKVIAEQAMDLSAIIDDLMVAARSDINAVTVVDEPVDMTKELGAVIHGLREDDRARIHQPTEHLTVRGDRLRIRQILRNLLMNGLRHGGDTISIELETSNGVGAVTVVDDGPGMSAEVRDRLFEPYFNASSDASQPASIGLGLTVSRFLARLMGGDLTVVPHPGGTAFQLTLATATPAEFGAVARSGYRVEHSQQPTGQVRTG